MVSCGLAFGSDKARGLIGNLMARCDFGQVLVGRRMRRFCAVFLAAALLLAGLGTSHAVAMPGTADGSQVAHHADIPAANHQAGHSHGTCDDGAAPAAKDPAMQHDRGCCASACFPAAMARDAVRLRPPHFDMLPVRPRADQAPALSSPNDLFRPPRGRA